jgi:hypothetical protein
LPRAENCSFIQTVGLLLRTLSEYSAISPVFSTALKRRLVLLALLETKTRHANSDGFSAYSASWPTSSRESFSAFFEAHQDFVD